MRDAAARARTRSQREARVRWLAVSPRMLEQAPPSTTRAPDRRRSLLASLTTSTRLDGLTNSSGGPSSGEISGRGHARHVPSRREEVVRARRAQVRRRNRRSVHASHATRSSSIFDRIGGGVDELRDTSADDHTVTHGSSAAHSSRIDRAGLRQPRTLVKMLDELGQRAAVEDDRVW